MVVVVVVVVDVVEAEPERKFELTEGFDGLRGRNPLGGEECYRTQVPSQKPPSRHLSIMVERLIELRWL